nr:24-hydroxycholesterol 7-alpha-hydroxylase isoform 2 [Sus scrofa]
MAESLGGPLDALFQTKGTSTKAAGLFASLIQGHAGQKPWNSFPQQ